MVFVLHTANERRHPWVRRWARGLLATVLLATLALAISRTLAASREAGDWVEICSDVGMQWVQVGVHGGGPALAESEALDRCGHYTLAVDRFTPLVPAVPVVVGNSGPIPVPEHPSPVAGAACEPVPTARGPPLLS